MLPVRAAAVAIQALAGSVLVCGAAHADEGGVSFWLPGTFGSLAAVPQQPGWSFGTVYYHTSVGASGRAAAAREITVRGLSRSINVDLNVNLKAQGDLALVAPSYTFATPILGGQLALGVTGTVGRSSAALNGTLTASVGGFAATRSGSVSDAITGFGDLYPIATLRWNSGVHNYMTYLTGDIPVGSYDSARLANLGIGHGAIDGGGGYTYLDPAAGREFSAVAGLTYNFKNTATDYRNGIDFHVDWAASQFLSKQVFIGAVGYVYQQITSDVGTAPVLGGFKSRVAAIGPQVGYLFPVGDQQGFLGLKGYREFAAENRPAGWNAWLTFSISPAAPTAAPPMARMVSK